METAIRQGKIPFYASDTFPYGLSRSGYFSIGESEELIKYGDTLYGLHNGLLSPENAEEAMFVAELNSDETATLDAVKLWKKFLLAITKSNSFNSLSPSKKAAF
ncbi:DUF413 domain-containing protein [Pseudoalteromonas sp. T1lg24]|uniref:DUF413 domain-containing protein n=1 Tax=Pseudoalteromonas sp. T1lg24 TaxID=2077099 RepID=UPI000CF74920|nr:DUF413 domain-containing protein [Pseudoalteromonas sp. T1lg24]